MKMIDILKQELKSGMSVESEKELSNKWKIVITYNGMKASVDLPKACTPSAEKEVCRKTIDTALSTMYVNAGNLVEAKKWLDGEFWKDFDKDDVYLNADGTLNDKNIIYNIHKAANMYENGEIIEACDVLLEIVNAIRDFENN